MQHLLFEILWMCIVERYNTFLFYLAQFGTGWRWNSRPSCYYSFHTHLLFILYYLIWWIDFWSEYKFCRTSGMCHRGEIIISVLLTNVLIFWFSEMRFESLMYDFFLLFSCRWPYYSRNQRQSKTFRAEEVKLNKWYVLWEFWITKM